MKIDELYSLVSEMDFSKVLIKSSNVGFLIEGKGDLKTTFPVPDCSNCIEKCCPPRVVISLFDVARFMDSNLENFVTGKFEGFVDLFLSENNEDIKLHHPHMNPVVSEPKGCVFLDDDKRCSIYEKRPFVCRSYPLAIRVDENKNKVAIWMGGCRNYNISTDEQAFRRLLDSAVQDYNEKLMANAVLMNYRTQLRELGFGKYMEDDWQILIQYNKKNKEYETQIKDMQKTIERLRAPQDYTNIMQRLQSDNDWLKEQIVNLEREMSQQREKAHSIISELTTQLSEQRKFMESIQKKEEPVKKGFWKR